MKPTFDDPVMKALWEPHLITLKFERCPNVTPSPETPTAYRTLTHFGGKDYFLYTPGPQDKTSVPVKAKF